jgi:Asp-tRNA(Asn)/Glu-tRNA(Gln) amidotransferase B subunit
MKYRHEITSETDILVIGKTFVQMTDDGPWEFASTFYRSKENLWFIGKPHEILARIGITTTPARAQEFSDLLDGHLGGFYYVAGASDGTDEAIKWIMGSLAAVLNERSLPFSKVSEVLPADYLYTFISYLKTGKFEKSFAKDVFVALLEAPRFDSPDHAVRLPPETVLDKVIADPRFKAVDANEIDSFIESIIAANPDQVAKVAEKPALLQWFLGQVLKASKGRAPAQVVKSKLEQRLLSGEPNHAR